MEVVSNKSLDLKEYFGHIVVMHENTENQKVEELKEVLDASGYQYFCLPVSNKELDKPVSFEETNIFNGCVCLIPVFTKDFFEEDKIFLKSQYWYYIGYVKSLHKDAILPFFTGETKTASLNDTPLHKLDFKNNITALMATVQEKYGAKLLCYNYYDNKVINKFASKRILYRNLCIKFKIYQTAFDNAKEFYSTQYGYQSDADFEEYLIKNVVGGCRVLSFGSAKRLNPPLMPYKDEVHTRVGDYPKAIVGKRNYNRLSDQERQETGVRAEFIINILMPVHKLLGTNFKCFLTLKDQESVYLLLGLFEGDFINKEPEFTGYIDEDLSVWMQKYPKETFIDDNNERLYFSIGLSSNSDVDENLGVGKYADYTYPQ